ncbi:unnamed protein product [Symbiodinium natans]|uniref:Uncharacterized protein n=1 Tax=Symbiodinium natans TaxID=878477 RepID=A0A812SG30_9DINO|nr:unnamed protein product [Symbiodinium natans]
MESGLPKTGTSTWVPRLIPRVPESPPKAAPRRRLKHHSETPSEVLSVVALPIWLGSPIQEDDVLLKDIKSIVPEDLHQHDDVIAIEEAESDSSFCATHRRFVDAAEHLEQAICVRQQLLGDEHEELLASIQKYVVSCNTWGVHCLSTGNFTAALELFKKAEAMTEADNVPNFKRRVALRAATFNNLCCYYRTRGKLNAALQFAEKALRIEQRYKEADSPASSYLNYAVLLSNSGRHHEALEHVERAVAVLHDHQRHEEAEGATEKPEPRETSQLLVVAHYNMFVENLHLKHFASSLQCLQRSVAVATNKLGSSHALTTRMKEVQAEAQVRLDRKASAERFRTTAAVVESSPVFFHFQDGHCHPWQKVQLAKADATRAQEILADQKQITLRRLRPVDPRPPEKPRVRSRRPKQQMYARLPAIGAKVTGRWWETHPKLLETEGYAGSPILAQQAHGAQPMVEARALRQAASPRGDTGLILEAEGTQAALTDARTDATIAQPLPLAPAQIVPPPPGAPPEVVASWEYHHRRLQLLDGHGQTALEPQRMQAITILRDRLDKRRQKGLPTPTDCRRHQAATCIQAGIRGYLVRQWTSEELAREMRRQRLLEASSGVCSPTSDAKKRMAFRVIYAARRAFVENNAAVKIQKVARGSMTRAKLKRQISEIAHSSAAKVQALARGRAVRSSLRRQTEAATQIQARARVMLAKRKTDTVRQMARSAEAERQVQEESDAVLAGILDAGLSSRWSSPIPMDYDRGSDASHVSEEAERQVQEESDAVLAGILDAGLSSRMGSPMPMDYDRGGGSDVSHVSEEAERQVQEESDAVLAGILDAGLSSRMGSPIPMDGDRGGGSDVSHVSEEAERQVQEESDAVLAGILNAGLSSRWSSPMPMDYDREGGSDVSLFSEVQTERQAENDAVCAGLLEASFSPRWVSRSDVSEACSEAERQAEGDAVLAGILDAGLSSRNSPMPMDYEGGSDISEACSEAERQAEGDAVLAGILDAGLSSRNSPMPMDYEGGSDISEARSAAERGVEADFFVQIIPDTTNSTLTIEDSGSIMTDIPLLDPYPKAVEVTPLKQRVHPGSCLASAPLQADAVSDVSPGVLRAGSTSPVDMDVDGRSDVSEETSGKVVASIVGSQLEEFAQACEGTSIVGLGGLEPPDSGIDDDVAGPSIEDLGKASSIADIHEEVENMVPAD